MGRPDGDVPFLHLVSTPRRAAHRIPVLLGPRQLPRESGSHVVGRMRRQRVQHLPGLVKVHVPIIDAFQYRSGGYLRPHIPLYLFDVRVFQYVESSAGAHAGSTLEHGTVGASESVRMQSLAMRLTEVDSTAEGAVDRFGTGEGTPVGGDEGAGGEGRDVQVGEDAGVDVVGKEAGRASVFEGEEVGRLFVLCGVLGFADGCGRRVVGGVEGLFLSLGDGGGAVGVVQRGHLPVILAITIVVVVVVIGPRRHRRRPPAPRIPLRLIQYLTAISLPIPIYPRLHLGSIPHGPPQCHMLLEFSDGFEAVSIGDGLALVVRQHVPDGPRQFPVGFVAGRSYPGSRGGGMGKIDGTGSAGSGGGGGGGVPRRGSTSGGGHLPVLFRRAVVLPVHVQRGRGRSQSVDVLLHLRLVGAVVPGTQLGRLRFGYRRHDARRGRLPPMAGPRRHDDVCARGSSVCSL
mmetsp:Transcript_28949/g.85612  ORF Transcript_28949/g.85612 Transcript_28949/m.85612 type:complete len:458 (-) Transcript_28949:196-1569(-)